jgi:hypothetical protein
VRLQLGLHVAIGLNAYTPARLVGLVANPTSRALSVTISLFDMKPSQ